MTRAFASFGLLLTAVTIGCADQPSPSPVSPGTQTPAEYRIQGSVSDRGGGLLADALVTVVGGPSAGITTRSNDSGRFELRGGMPGMATLSASRDGFETQSGTALWQPVDQPGVQVAFRLNSLEPAIGLEPGVYTLAVSIDLANARDWRERPDAPCAGFPSALASRSYRAEIKDAAGPAFYTHTVTADDPTLRWPGLFAFYIAGNHVGFDMEGGPGAGLYEDFPGFRYLEIGGFSMRTRPGIRDGSSVSIPFEGAISYCHLKSARGANEDCYQVPADRILEHHVCFFDRGTLVFTKRD